MCGSLLLRSIFRLKRNQGLILCTYVQFARHAGMSRKENRTSITIILNRIQGLGLLINVEPVIDRASIFLGISMTKPDNNMDISVLNASPLFAPFNQIEKEHSRCSHILISPNHPSILRNRLIASETMSLSRRVAMKNYAMQAYQIFW